VKSGITARSIALCFVIVLGVYLAIFYGIEYSNQRQGPWEVRFISDGLGNPSIVIQQPRLNVSAVKIMFGGDKAAQTNLSQKVLFDHPVTSLPVQMPFGEVIYEDLRALPGVVTFNFFGHEVELLPRVLIVNKKEIRWRSQAVIELSPTNKLPQPPRPPKGWETNAPAGRISMVRGN